MCPPVAVSRNTLKEWMLLNKKSKIYTYIFISFNLSIFKDRFRKSPCRFIIFKRKRKFIHFVLNLTTEKVYYYEDVWGIKYLQLKQMSRSVMTLCRFAMKNKRSCVKIKCKCTNPHMKNAAVCCRADHFNSLINLYNYVGYCDTIKCSSTVGSLLRLTRCCRLK